MSTSSPLASFPVTMIPGAGLQVSRQGASLRVDLVDEPFAAVKDGGVYRVDTGTGLTALKTGLRLLVKPTGDSDGPAMLSVDGIGLRPWLDADGSPLYNGLVRKDAFTIIRGDAERGWLLEAGGLGSTGLSFDVSGTLAGRATYNAAAAGFVYLAIEDGPGGSAWTLYTKRTAASADWSSGLQIKAAPAQSTVEAQAAAAQAAQERLAAAAQATAAAEQVRLAANQVTQAAGQVRLAGLQAAAAAAQVPLAAAQVALAAGQVSLAGDQAALAAAKADAARLAAIDAAGTAAVIGLQVFDFSLDSAASPTDDWSN